MMVGYGSTEKSGRQYHYYNFKNARKKKCQKKIVSKEYIEDRVVAECLKLLTERINQRKAEKAELEEQLAIEQNKEICLTEPQIHVFWIMSVKCPQTM